jgi:ribose transport system substrate-binding protein
MKAVAGAALVAATLAMSACSSSGGSSSSTTAAAAGGSGSAAAGGDAGVQAAKAFSDKYLPQPQKIDVSVPLPSAPPTGKSAYYIINTDPAAVRVANGVKEAGQALGWKVTVLTFTDPTAANGLILQAVQAKADFIGYIAVPSSLLTSGIAAARAANIPVFQSFDATPPAGKVNWIFGNIGGVQDFVLRGKILADYVIAQSNGKANILMENVPAFAVLTSFAQGFKDELKTNCPSCGYAENNSPYTDVAGGKVPGIIVSYLRTHPKVNNVVFSTGGFGTGFPDAANAAGIKVGGSDGIQITSQSISPANAKGIAAGQELASVTANDEYQGWLVVDGMARYSVNASLEPNWKAATTPRIITKETASEGDKSAAPVDYQTQFKTLWKIS